MLSLSWNILAERWRLRNSTPFPMDLVRVGRGKDAVKGSKSNSSTKLPLELRWFRNCVNMCVRNWGKRRIYWWKDNDTYDPLTSSSLKWRYSGTVNSSTTRAFTFTLTYSQTPGLRRIASATHGGDTIASYQLKNQRINRMQDDFRLVLWVYSIIYLCGFENFMKGTIMKFGILLADCIKLSHELVRLQYSFSTSLFPWE